MLSFDACYSENLIMKFFIPHIMVIFLALNCNQEKSFDAPTPSPAVEGGEGEAIGKEVWDGSGAGDSHGNTQVNPPSKEVIDQKRKSCTAGALKEVEKVITFEATKHVSCEWEQKDGKEYQGENVLSGKYVQKETVYIDHGETICEIGFDFGDVNSSSKDNKYDDLMFLTVNPKLSNGDHVGDLLIASTHNYNNHFEKANDFFVYDWNVLKFKPFDTRENNKSPYCIGDVNCKIPEHDTAGEFYIELSKDRVQNFTDLMASANKLEFAMVITGDNNPKIDCKHQNDFTIKLTFKIAE